MANLFIKGSVSVSVDELEMEARLVFMPGKKEEMWNSMTLDGLIRKRQLPAVPPKTLDDFLEQIVNSRRPAELVIAKGQAAADPVPERVAWTKTQIPGEIAPFADGILAEAGPPEIFRTRTERAPGEGSPPQREDETYRDEEFFQERVKVDPAVLAVRYAEKGQPAGSVTPAQPGKTGKTIFGKVLKPEEIPGGGILFGIGLELQKTWIVPTVTGILRIGRGWADVVPVPQPSWTLETGNAGEGLFLGYTPGHSRYPPPPAGEILEGIEAPEGFVLMDAEELDAAIMRATAAGETLEHIPLFRAAARNRAG